MRLWLLFITGGHREAKNSNSCVMGCEDAIQSKSSKHPPTLTLQHLDNTHSSEERVAKSNQLKR